LSISSSSTKEEESISEGNSLLGEDEDNYTVDPTDKEVDELTDEIEHVVLNIST